MAKTAVIIADMIRDFIDPDGTLWVGESGGLILPYVAATVDRMRRPDCLAFLDWFTHKRGSFTPATYNMGVEFWRQSSTFLMIVSNAPLAAEPGSSCSTAPRMAASTSGGKSVEVRRTNSRILSVRSGIISSTKSVFVDLRLD